MIFIDGLRSILNLSVVVLYPAHSTNAWILIGDKNVFCNVYFLTENYGFDVPDDEYFLKIKKGFLQNKIEFNILKKSYEESYKKSFKRYDV